MSKTIRRVAVRLGLKLALLLGASAAACGMAEVALRLEGHHLIGDGEVITAGSIFRSDDPPVGYSLQPGGARTMISGGAFTSTEFINDLGMRDTGHRLAKSPGQRRILVLGDSFMFGYGVAEEATWEHRLQAMSRGVEVINDGIPGYDLGQEYLLYADRAYRFDADVVVLGFFSNDLMWKSQLTVKPGSGGLPAAYVIRPEVLAREARERSGPGAGVSSWLRGHSLLYVLVRKRLESLMSGTRHGVAPGRSGLEEYFTAFRTMPDATPSPDWQRAWRILDALERLTAAHRARLVVMTVPASFQMTEKAWADWLDWWKVAPDTVSRLQPNRMLEAWCRAPGRLPGTACHDLLPDFQSAGDPGTLFHPHDLHWTERGHAVAAQAMKSFLESLHLM